MLCFPNLHIRYYINCQIFLHFGDEKQQPISKSTFYQPNISSNESARRMAKKLINRPKHNKGNKTQRVISVNIEVCMDTEDTNPT